MNKVSQLLQHGYLPKQMRSGCKDVWNAFMLKGATYSEHDIPLCPTYIPNGLPVSLISYQKACTLFNKEMSAGNTDFHCNSFVHFYCDDYLFDEFSPDAPLKNIWLFPHEALSLLKHFAGIITVDYSTYADFPDPLKRYNTYRMRAFGFWCRANGIPVINNVRWGTEETWEYCFDGIEKNSIICIGTVASGLRELENRYDFNIGFNKMLEVLSPKIIVVYGSANYEPFKKAAASGITIIPFMSETNQAHHNKKGGDHYE